MNVYEGLFVLDASMYDENPDAVSGRLAEMVGREGGEMLHSSLWNERTLNYGVPGHLRAIYWLSYFRCDPERIKAVSDLFQNEACVLRYLFIVIDPKLVDTLVDHAKKHKPTPQEDDEKIDLDNDPLMKELEEKYKNRDTESD